MMLNLIENNFIDYYVFASLDILTQSTHTLKYTATSKKHNI